MTVKPQKAEPVKAWAVIPTLQSKISWRTYPTRDEARRRQGELRKKLGFRACRIARVEIREVEIEE